MRAAERSEGEGAPVDGERLARVEEKLDALHGKLDRILARQEKTTELIDEMMPIAKLALGTATTKLAGLEERGYFAFGRELLLLVDNIVTGYSPEDVHALGDNVVHILDVVRRVTQRETLDLLAGAANAAQEGDHADPMGVMGVLQATRKDEDVRRGLAIVVEALRQVGRVAHEGAPHADEPKRKMNPLLGAKRNLKPSGDTRATLVERAERAKAPPPKPDKKPTALAEPSVEGVAVDAEGFLVDPAAWSEELATRLADAHGLALTDAHWTVLRFIRADFEKNGAAPNIRRITTTSGVSTKDLYALFPKAPAKTAARIAGVKKPVGCV